MEYVVIETGGKQYKVQTGDTLEVDRIEGATDSVSFDRVLLHVVDGNVTIGKPYISSLNIQAKVLDNMKGKKIRVARFTAKSRHRRVVGFRPSITRVQIEKIEQGKTAKSTPIVAKIRSAKVVKK